MSARLKITQVRSSIGRPSKHGRTLRALGLSRMNQTVVHRDTPQIRGMVFQIQHLLRVEEFASEEQEE